MTDSTKKQMIDKLVDVLLNDSSIQAITTDIQSGDVDRPVSKGTSMSVTGGTDAIISPIRSHVGIVVIVYTRKPLRKPSDDDVNNALGALLTSIQSNRKLGGLAKSIISYESEPYVETEDTTTRTSVISIIYEVINK